ncbi:MAG: NUDIX domain-containing protein [Clostridium argentinense]|nr:NUDIX domain-containing protein [Clostridium argentinense]
MNIEFNVIATFDSKCKHILMCKRRKNPYKGLYNLVGGKIESGEDGLSSAYRELEEETGISKNDIILTHLMDFTYYLPSIKLEVYVGRLNKEVSVHGDENDLEWVEINQNFFDISKYAGEGNIGHIMEHILLSKEILLK